TSGLIIRPIPPHQVAGYPKPRRAFPEVARWPLFQFSGLLGHSTTLLFDLRVQGLRGGVLADVVVLPEEIEIACLFGIVPGGDHLPGFWYLVDAAQRENGELALLPEDTGGDHSPHEQGQLQGQLKHHDWLARIIGLAQV
ncbi:MAG: hypothetical protein JZU63_10190, partial [Rhodoferax sp.]|nr:hypothetical protein [Rhodoferax sp.]